MSRIVPIKSLDSRDYTKKPPAKLDPWWVLAIRRALKDFDNHRNEDVFRSNMYNIHFQLEKESTDGKSSDSPRDA